MNFRGNVGVGKRGKGSRLWEYTHAMVEADFLKPPLWYEAMKTHPPMRPLGGNKAKELHLPEDRLRRVVMKRRPLMKFESEVAPPGDNIWFAAPWDIFIQHQSRYLQLGFSERDSFDLADDRLRERDYRKGLMIRLAMEGAQRNGWVFSLASPNERLVPKRFNQELDSVADAHRSRNRILLEELVSSLPEGMTIDFEMLSQFDFEDVIDLVMEKPEYVQHFPFSTPYLNKVAEAAQTGILSSTMKAEIYAHMKDWLGSAKQASEEGTVDPIVDGQNKQILRKLMSHEIGRIMEGSPQKDASKLSNAEKLYRLGSLISAEWDPDMKSYDNVKTIHQLVELLGTPSKPLEEGEKLNFLETYVRTFAKLQEAREDAVKSEEELKREEEQEFKAVADLGKDEPEEQNEEVVESEN